MHAPEPPEFDGNIRTSFSRHCIRLHRLTGNVSLEYWLLNGSDPKKRILICEIHGRMRGKLHLGIAAGDFCWIRGEASLGPFGKHWAGCVQLLNWMHWSSWLCFHHCPCILLEALEHFLFLRKAPVQTWELPWWGGWRTWHTHPAGAGICSFAQSSLWLRWISEVDSSAPRKKWGERTWLCWTLCSWLSRAKCATSKLNTWKLI